MTFLNRVFFALYFGHAFLASTSYKLIAQENVDVDFKACLTRFKVGEINSYRIPLTKFCFVRNAGISKDYTNGWIMKWEIVEKPNSNLLLMEMNSTEVKGWLSNKDIRGSMQLVVELPLFSDSLVLNKLTNSLTGLYSINSYGGISVKKNYLTGCLLLTKSKENILITSTINLITDSPNTKQQIILSNNPVQSISFTKYQELENTKDSTAEADTKLLVNTLTTSVIVRDSIWQIDNARIKDSMKLHPYTGKFRFWVSHVDKAGYARTTYSISHDSLIVKEGPYDFIYLAKNYFRDSVYFKRKLNKAGKALISRIEKRIICDTSKSSYTNFCIMDGLILSLSFESVNISKDITVSNYYNGTVAFIVDVINKISPKKYQIWYNKKILSKQQSNCNK